MGFAAAAAGERSVASWVRSLVLIGGFAFQFPAEAERKKR